LVEDPKLKDVIRTLRQKRLETFEGENVPSFDPEDARTTIMKMAAVTPSVYLDDVLLRIGHGDESAIEDLGLVITLTESETLGFKS
jgi:hypothetical protein